VGTGAGDLLAAVVRRERERERPIHAIGVDLHATTLAVTRHRVAEPIRLVRGDGLRLPFPDAAFDLVHLGMVLHHMDGDRLPGLLREAARVARNGRILVSELERTVANYLGARLLAATVWRFNSVTRHDGPLSVLRAFTPDELLTVAASAGLGRVSVHRHPFYRLVLRAEA
jgi:ubiquinone/menaquinone biosynthesis C-methylase UbiE